MLFIFRKIRRSFFLPGKVRTYLAYAVGEIILIVVGILIAVQIGDWNQERKARVQERILLAEIHDEFLYNKAELESIAGGYRAAREKLDTLIASFPLDLETVDLDFVAEILDLSHTSGDMDEATTTIEKLKSSSFDILSNKELGNLLLQWTVKIEDLNGAELRTFNQYFNFYLPTMRAHLPRPYREGFKDPRANLDFLESFEFEELVKERSRRMNAYSRFVDDNPEGNETLLEITDRIIELSKPSD